MDRLERSASQIWAFGPNGKVQAVITLGGHHFDTQGMDRDLRGLGLAVHWTRISVALWLQDIRQILGGKA